MMRTAAALVMLAGVAGVGGGQCIAAPPVRFVDVTEEAGLGGLAAARVAFVDINGSGRPDVVVDRHRVFLNTDDAEAPLGFRFVEVQETGLPALQRGDVVVFADLDNDGIPDAIIARYLDINRDGFEPPEAPARTAWLRGRGDGTFGEARIIEAAQRATVSSIAVGDVDLDGRLDLYIGTWYTRYGQSVEAFSNDLLLQAGRDSEVEFVRQPLHEDGHGFDDETDLAGRPTYGVMIASVLKWAPYADVTVEEPVQGVGYPGMAEGQPPPPHPRGPQLLELNYGRRANRLWGGPMWTLTPGELAGIDVAPKIGLDGDDIRHGRHPEWLKIVAERDPRFARRDEKPFRSHGNTFDAAIGDVNNDGLFDIFVAEITHGWAGDSSDRSRLLMAGPAKSNPMIAFEPSRQSFDRIPPIPPRDEWAEGWFPRWNQGDLYCEFADLDSDGLLDVIISSGDYPDPAPYDQRLRIYRQNEDGSFTDVTADSGIDHVGSQQISLGDVNGDGQLDVLVGQSFTRMTPEMIAAASGGTGEPRLRLFLNQTRQEVAEAPGGSVTLTLIGDHERGINREALGSVVRMETSATGRARFQSRQLIGIGGHAGKQHQFLVHFGLGDAARVDRIEIHWPSADGVITLLRDVPPGHHIIRAADHLP